MIEGGTFIQHDGGALLLFPDLCVEIGAENWARENARANGIWWAIEDHARDEWHWDESEYLTLELIQRWVSNPESFDGIPSVPWMFLGDRELSLDDEGLLIVGERTIEENSTGLWECFADSRLMALECTSQDVLGYCVEPYVNHGEGTWMSADFSSDDLLHADDVVLAGLFTWFKYFEHPDAHESNMRIYVREIVDLTCVDDDDVDEDFPRRPVDELRVMVHDCLRAQLAAAGCHVP